MAAGGGYGAYDTLSVVLDLPTAAGLDYVPYGVDDDPSGQVECLRKCDGLMTELQYICNKLAMK